MPGCSRLGFAVALLLAATVPATAHADGDPASDILLAQDAYYPYAPNAVGRPLQAALDLMLRSAKTKGFELKVAMLAAPADLGAVPQLFTAPQKYANLLTSEIAFNTKPRVLVLLPAGLGGNNLGDKAGEALAGIAPVAADGPDGLAQAAMLAVGRLSAANGTPVAVPAVARARSRLGDDGPAATGTSPLLIFGVPVLLVAVVAGGAAVAGRRGDPNEPALADSAVPAVADSGRPDGET